VSRASPPDGYCIARIVASDQEVRDESLERHVVRCPNGGMRHLLPSGLVGVIRSCLRDAGVPDAAIVLEARGLRAADRSRPGGEVAPDFLAYGRRLDIDIVITTAFRNTVLHQVANIPGYAAKQAEDMKFLADKNYRQPIAASNGGHHVLVPFAMEDEGRLGAHAHALLRALAKLALAKGRIPYPMLVFMWVRLWPQGLYACMVALGFVALCHGPPLACY